MPEFHEQIRLVSTLRQKCRECDEALYRARVDLQRTNLRLQRAQQKQTIVDRNRDELIARLRANMDRLNAELGNLREQERQLETWFSQLAEQQGIRDHLQQNLKAVETRIATLREQLAQLPAPAPADETKTLRDELEKLQGVKADISAALERLTATLGDLEAQRQQKESARQQLQVRIEARRAELNEEQTRLTDLLRPVFQNPDDLEARKRDIHSSINQLNTDCGDCDGKLHEAIGGIYLENPHPRGALARLNDRIPFLLLPMRIETIFVPGQGVEGQTTSELWVRVYPDEIAIHTHEKVLTDREVVAGELYWTELVAAAYLRNERDPRRRSAWRQMVELFGGQRGAWVAQQTKPSDYDTLVASGETQTLIELVLSIDANFFNLLLALDMSAETRAALQEAIANNDGDAFSRLADKNEWFSRVNTMVRQKITGFPTHDLTTTEGWTRAPRTNVLPDRFVLMLYGRDTDAPREIIGNIIPDTMFVGPDPLDAEAAFENKDQALVFGESFNWMSDFDRAVDLGMGFRVRLDAAEARAGFAKILVLGVFLSADAPGSAGLLEELVENHQFGPKGFSLVLQGTPTNNTERDGSGYSDNDPFDDLAFFNTADPPAFDPDNPDPFKSQTDGRLLADALGIKYAMLQTVQRANQTDALEASSMNKALFPITLGYWLRNWMNPVISPEVAQNTRSFFNSFVSGRGPLPAVRVGNQPYGILLTSDFSRWKYPENPDPIFVRLLGNRLAFLKDLYKLLASFEGVWSNIAGTLPFVGKPGSDSADVLMNILGLHPTSVEFFQRIGYSDEYLRNLMSFTDGGRYANELQSLLRSMPATARFFLQLHGINRDLKTVSQMKGLHVLWQHYVTPLNVPNLVENKPPSERNQLTINYINLLATTTDTDKIVRQDFGVQVPAALLYLMLRNALLLQLYHGSYEWLKERTAFEPTLEKSLAASSLMGMRATSPAVSKVEIMGAHVGLAEPANPTPNVSVANVIWNGPDPAAVEGAYLKEQKAALEKLVSLPTARLERCLVEHIDCCNYRLDAWQTGLFTERLQAQRKSGGPSRDRETGIYLGAYGWVEDVTPVQKAFLSRDSLPAVLRPADQNPVLEEDDVMIPGNDVPKGSKRGGFVHAPSLNHASAAALLRNAYLSHANPQEADMFATNLSSERVRRAEFILEGMRNGQPIEALLGYQFERGLHDRTSESAAHDVTVLELNQFIAPFRQVFPFESREVVQAGTGGPTETLPAYSVVNGLRLMDASLSGANGFGLATVLAPAQLPNANQGAAITAEQDALRDTLDAVKDLLMAENAYQLVRGNFDRVAAVSLSQKDAHIPPDLEVIETPRSTEFTFTNRVTLHFADLDPALASSNPWPAIAMTPRANAEAGMNQWLGTIFGARIDKILCEVAWVEKAADGTETLHDQHRVTLADLHIQPIDFVWLVSISADDSGGATELETRIVFHYRRTHSISDDKIARISFGPVVAADETTFAQLFPLTRHVRALLLENRALHAEDFLPASGGEETAIPVDENNRKGYDALELRSRVQAALNALTTFAETIDGSTAPSVQLVILNDPTTPVTLKLGDAFTKLEEAKLTFGDTDKVTTTFSLADAETLHQNLRSISGFGLSDAFPPESDLTIAAARIALLARAHRTARRIRRSKPADGVLDRATSTFNLATPDKLIEAQVQLLLAAGKILLGENFNYLPRFSYHNQIDLATADTDRNQLLDHATTADTTREEVVDEWLQGLARVRPKLHRWEVVRTLADALNDVVLEVLPVQVPYRIKDSWLAVEFPETDPTDTNVPPRAFGISRDTLSIAAHGATAFQAGVRQSGILIDDWTEEIPTAQETTGIAFRYNQPNATPPQALLLVVTPEETGSWDWDDLVGTLNDTLQRAKRRAVEPSQLEGQGTVWNSLAPALVSEFSAVQLLDVSLDLMRVLDFALLNQFYARTI
jgi:hypothetical protein